MLLQYWYVLIEEVYNETHMGSVMTPFWFTLESNFYKLLVCDLIFVFFTAHSAHVFQWYVAGCSCSSILWPHIRSVAGERRGSDVSTTESIQKTCYTQETIASEHW